MAKVRPGDQRGRMEMDRITRKIVRFIDWEQQYFFKDFYCCWLSWKNDSSPLHDHTGFLIY